ncbi:CU044_2847 family protein [Mastigocoleus sp. MO_188.B34]|uniref:CU044_2847 family protein n=1 Tax=Mastigocoleus sp. MO_188.B34 TaxID=3036635 RepID=UPI002616B690|nr:CU044_2847 family protein [Mastigocoleus sp. MO_188.B34]MDJ0697663.1 CU044_2847 family protein [Mastigocoleus sp. MO_188.B34]
MVRELLELKTEDNSTILVAVEVLETNVGRVSAPGETPIKKLDQSFSIVKDLIVRASRPLTKAFQQLHEETRATDAEVELGINFTSKGSVYLVEASGKASLKVTLKWNLIQEPKITNRR